MSHDAMDARGPHIRAGAVRYKGSDGNWITVSPDQPLYSTATMVAQEYWENGAWVPVLDADEDDA